MVKKQQKCIQNCQKHHFIMKPVQYFAYISRNIQVSFCPPTLKHHPIYPIFNKDKKCYTSSFYLKQDKLKYQTNDYIYLKQHQKFCKQQLNGKSQMVSLVDIQLQPKPRSKVLYCHICKDHYQDYSQHVKSITHKQTIRANKYSTYINQLIQDNYSQHKPFKQIDSHQYQQYFIKQKQITSTITLPSSSSIQQPKINQGFILVSEQALYQSIKINQYINQNPGHNPNQKPQSENISKKYQTYSLLRSQNKCNTGNKLPIIISLIQ